MPTFLHDPHQLANSLHRGGIGAFFRPQELEDAGISYGELRRLVHRGDVERVSRGLYRLTAAEPTQDYSLAAVSAQVPNSIVCLLSALRVHEIGTRVPAQVWLAIPHKARPPRIHGTHVRLIRFSGAAWTYGIVDTRFESVPARITNPARTIVDCFRYERLVGRETSMEALRDALREKKVTTDALIRTLEMVPSTRLTAVLEAIEA